MNVTVSTEALLAERGKTHGEYAEHARVTQDILRACMAGRRWDELSDCQKESMHMFAHKMGRIVTGNPDHHDHWEDIAGYAKLVSQRIPGAAQSTPRPEPAYATVGDQIRAAVTERLVPRMEPYRPGTPEDGGHYVGADEGDPD
jgi:hypothetical protein